MLASATIAFGVFSSSSKCNMSFRSCLFNDACTDEYRVIVNSAAFEKEEVLVSIHIHSNSAERHVSNLLKRVNDIFESWSQLEQKDA